MVPGSLIQGNKATSSGLGRKDGTYNIVDFHDAPDSFTGESDGRCRDQEWLDHMLIQNVCDHTLKTNSQGSGDRATLFKNRRRTTR